jgi:choline dehydrogenase-like flavoprotein
MALPGAPDCDYLIVGSGAGGGTLAARLAEAGMRVLLLEAGGDPRSVGPRLPDDYDVPAFHPFASENPGIAWDFYVSHYADETQAARDPKRTPKGIFYPRAGTLGGCTAHNAMIFVAPHDSDWDHLAELTGDETWSAAAMHALFRRIERCHHRPIWRWLKRLTGFDRTGHGWGGWLSVERCNPTDALADRRLVASMLKSGLVALQGMPGWLADVRRLVRGKLDPNDRRMRGAEGIWYAPLATARHRRVGTRERVLDVAARHPDRLKIELHALATRVLFDGDRAVGVEYLKGPRLYRATPQATDGRGERRQAFAAREVIVCGGAFNSPQLLMLSGIGPRDALAGLGIAPRVDLPGVGRNLQDRYEVGVVYRMARPWEALAGARFEAGDPLYAKWRADGSGMYGSNGAALALTRRSRQSAGAPDLFLMGTLARFDGYYPGYSSQIGKGGDGLTWCVLKGGTRNRAGTVTLNSADPRDPPRIGFNNFAQGGDADLAAVVEGVELARALTAPLRRGGLIAEEILPGEAVQGPALDQWVRDNAWGHHASCTCAIGPREAGGVVDGNFRVHGVSGLRVVDASVFPRIPGFFIVSAIYTIAEKAADAILADAGKGPGPRPSSSAGATR